MCWRSPRRVWSGPSDGRSSGGDSSDAVPGFGAATWECFAMQLGVPTAASRAVVCDFIAEALALESPATETQADDLVAAAAVRLEVTGTTFTHAVWRYQRRQRRAAGAR